MANDLMRTGPRGASDQAANLSPRVIRLLPIAAASVTYANLKTKVEQGISNVGNPGTGTNPLDTEASNGTATVFYGFPGLGQDDTWYGQWTVRKIFAVCNRTGWATANSGQITAGIYALTPVGAPAAVTTVDANAIKASGVIPFATLPTSGAKYELGLNGVGAGLNDNGGTVEDQNLVSYKIGVGAGQFTDGGVSVQGCNQFLGVVAPTAGGTGTYVMYAELVPAGGENYSS
tara:strand:+ start:5316 stop:6011 length:696 start_codon:yes stop_codon:yes gene_type:complete